MSDLIYSEAIANAISDYLKENGWHFSFDDDLGVFHFNWNITKSRIRKLKYIIDVRPDDFTTYARPEFSADEEDTEMMGRLSECINRINYGLRTGNFELDYRDGELRFKYFADCPGGSLPTPEIIENSIHLTAAMYRRYAPALMDVIFANANPREAVSKCEPDDDIREVLEELLDEDSDASAETLLSRLLARLAGPEEGNDEPKADDDGILLDLFGADDSDE